MKDISFEKSLTLTKFALLMSGMTIYQSKWSNSIHVQRTLSFLFYFNFLWVYVDVIGEFYWLLEGIQVGKSVAELSMTAPCTALCLLATAKSTPLYYNRHLLDKVVNKLRDMHPDEDEQYDIDANEDLETEDVTKPIDEKKYKTIESKIAKDSTKFLVKIILLLYSCSAVVVTVFSFLPIMQMGYDYYKGRQVELLLPFLAKYFFEPDTKPRWAFIYFHQVWSTFIVCFNVFGADTFLYAFCTYIQMHFRILCNRYEHMVSESSVETSERLRQLVRRHQELIALVDSMEIMYSKSTLFNIVTSSVLICLSGFNVTFLDDAGVVFAFLTFLFMSLSQISLLCLFGDMLQTSSIKVSTAIYKCRWYETDAPTKKSLLLMITSQRFGYIIILPDICIVSLLCFCGFNNLLIFFDMCRAQKPCKLTAANFADLNLSAFTTIMSRSWSYFALLKTMYN